MHEALYIVVGAVVGGILCTIGFGLGAYFIKSTYLELTQPHTLTPNTVEDNTKEEEQEAYNWDTYDDYSKPTDEAFPSEVPLNEEAN